MNYMNLWNKMTCKYFIIIIIIIVIIIVINFRTDVKKGVNEQ